MSLDVYLTIDGTEVFWANITHNLGKMASEAGIYDALWRPDENGIEKASGVAEVLKERLPDMVARPSHYKQFDSTNGWGMYRDFLPWLAEYLEACEKYPDADVGVWR